MLRWCDMVSGLGKQADSPRDLAGNGLAEAPFGGLEDSSATFIVALCVRPDVKESNILFDTMT